MKNFFKKWDYIIITVMVSLEILIFLYALQNIAPFGGNSLLTIDFFHQYGPMLAELRDRILSGSNLIYSFRMGMGLPFFRNFFNYLSSPFNVLLILFKHSDVLMSYSVIIGLKAMCSAITMVIFLNKKFGKNYAFIALSVLYAFSAYFTAYYWNIMWLDGMLMIPLITYGIEELVNKNKILLYIISLAIMLFANYFIGYMLCIYSVLYFITYLFIKTNKFNVKEIIKKCLRFAGASLIAGGLCAVFLIPLYLGLKEISATSDIIPNSQYYAFTFKEFFFNHFSGVGSTVLKSGITCAPNISIGVLSVGLLILFIINPKIDLKVTIGYLGLLLFLAISFRWAFLDFVWHAFHVPNDLPYRYSFIYSFILTIICAYSIRYIKAIKPLFVGVSYGISLILITLMKILNFENISSDMLIVNYIVITIYYLCYIMCIYFKKWKKWALCFLIISAALECVMVINNNWYIDQSIEGFYSDYDAIKQDLDYIKENDNEFYRLEKTSMLTFNDPSWYGYNGQVTFSSMEYENMAILQHSLGMPGNEINSYYYKQNTPIYDLMFNIKYLIGETKDNARYSLFYQGSDSDVYKFKYNVGLMFGVNNELINYHATFDSPFKNQNEFMEKATGINNVLEKIKNTSNDIVYKDDGHTIVKYSFKNIGDNYYLYFASSHSFDFVVVGNTLYINGDYDYVSNYTNIQVYNYVDYNENFIINGSADKDVDVYIGYSYELNTPLNIYKLNIDKFDIAYNYLLKNKVDIIEFNDSYIKAKSNFDESKLIYTSIPYDKGWRVYVDGEEVETYAISDILLSYIVPEGDHTIELKYNLSYFNISLIISLLSLSFLALWMELRKKD